MKRMCILCFALCLLLCLPGCITLQYEEGNTHVSYQDTTAPTDVQTTQAPATQLQQNNPYALNWTTAEIVSLYNDAVNRAKANAEPYTLQESVSHAVSIADISSEAMRSAAQSVLDKINRFSDTTYDVYDGIATSGEMTVRVNDILPPYGAPFALHEANVIEAIASFDGEYIIIEMLLRDDTATAQQAVPALHGGHMPYLSLNGQDIAPYAIKQAQLQYSQMKITTAIDNYGKLISVTASASVSGSASGGVGLMSANVSFEGTLREVRMLIYK